VLSGTQVSTADNQTPRLDETRFLSARVGGPWVRWVTFNPELSRRRQFTEGFGLTFFGRADQDTRPGAGKKRPADGWADRVSISPLPFEEEAFSSARCSPWVERQLGKDLQFWSCKPSPNSFSSWLIPPQSVDGMMILVRNKPEG